MEGTSSKIYDIIEQFKQLDEHSQQAVANYILSLIETGGRVFKFSQIEASESRERMSCPHCGSHNVYKKGKYKDVQMYVCRDCGRSYRETTGTALYGIKKRELLPKYIKLMLQGCSLRCIAKELGISLQTSFDWRHKILSALKDFEPEELSGYIQVDEMELPLSEKGNKDLKRKPRRRGNDYKRNKKDGTIDTVQVVSAVNEKVGIFRVIRKEQM